MERKKRNRRRRSTLTLYLDRVAEGDETYRQKLCKNLADRTLYVPLDGSDDAFNEQRDLGITIKVKQMKYAGKQVVPVFTDQRLYKEWETRTAHKTDSVALMGADLCAVLPFGLWLLLDHGGESEVLLDMDAVESIAAVGDQALREEFKDDFKEIFTLQETDIIELTTPLEEADTDSMSGSRSEADNKPVPTGLRGWLGL